MLEKMLLNNKKKDIGKTRDVMRVIYYGDFLKVKVLILINLFIYLSFLIKIKNEDSNV